MSVAKWDDNQIKQIKTNAKKCLDRAAILLQNAMIKKLSTPGRGIKWETLKYQSSAPGDPPTVQDGTLRSSIQIDRSLLEVFKIYIGSNLDYGFFLEYGTKSIAPRPWARPALAETRAAIQAQLSNDNLLKGI